jgi:hypothetical protein
MKRLLLCALMGLVFTPIGILVLRAAFTVQEPHIFVMFIFSGSLSLLIGLAGLAGLLMGLGPQERKSK